MSRVINTNSPTKLRNRNRRTIAEMLHRLVRQPQLSEEGKDQAALIVESLKEIDQGLAQTIAAWEKRDYWIKAERFSQEWQWAGEIAYNMDDVLRNQAWDLLPDLLIALTPRFSDISIKSYTRKPIFWNGAYHRLMAAEPAKAPW